MHRARSLAFVLAVLAAAPLGLAAQGGNFLMPMPRIEALLRDSSFQVIDARGARAEGDRTSRVGMQFAEDVIMIAQWAPAARGGAEFNNEPRYEVAAFELQRLFLGPDEYVVPPTVLRALPTPYVQQYFPRAQSTFRDAESVVLVMQYWLSAVTPEDFWNEQRFADDSVYARYFANMNLVTHIIDHRDANIGNFLVSTVPSAPRVFAVDNGVAFRSQRSDRGTTWRNLRVDRVPHATVERLRAITEEDLHRALGVIAEFEVRDGLLWPRPPTENINDGRGVRTRDGIVQFGLTRGEIRDVMQRITRLLERVDQGRIQTF